MIHSIEWCNSPGFLSCIKWCPITWYWSDIALNQMGCLHQFISSYWISANINGYLAHVLLKHLSAIPEMMNRLAGFVCEKDGKGTEEKKKRNVLILPANYSSHLALTEQECLPVSPHLFHTSSCMPRSGMLTFCAAHCLFFIDNQVNN